MKIALIQVTQNKLYDFGDNGFNIEKKQAKILQNEMIEKNLKLIEEAAKRGVDIIVTTEAINFTRMNNECDKEVFDLFPKQEESTILKYLSNIAERSNCYIVGSLYNWQANEKLCNSAYIYGRNGQLIDVYNKIHLAGSEAKILTRGNSYVTFDTEFGKIGVCICWDMQFPEVSRELVLDGAELILCPTWGWEGIYGHSRAYENGVFVAAAMSVPYNSEIEGIRNPSEVVGPDGRVKARASNDKDEILITDIDLKECKKFKELRMRDRQATTYKKISEK